MSPGLQFPHGPGMKQANPDRVRSPGNHRKCQKRNDWPKKRGKDKKRNTRKIELAITHTPQQHRQNDEGHRPEEQFGGGKGGQSRVGERACHGVPPAETLALSRSALVTWRFFSPAPEDTAKLSVPQDSRYGGCVTCSNMARLIS